MVKYQDKFAFARYWLQKQNFEVYSGKDRILPPVNNKEFDEYQLSFTPYFYTNEIIRNINPEIREITDYEELMKLGIAIVSKPVRDSPYSFRDQKIEYKFADISRISKHRGLIPRKHIVLYDAKNHCFKLIGKNVLDKGWYKLNRAGGELFHKPKTEFNPYSLNKSMKAAYSIYNEWGSSAIKQTKKKILINALPIMKSDDNKLVCIKQHVNEPRALVPGESEFGKSYFLHATADRAFYEWGKYICYLNDIQRECSSMCLVWNKDSVQCRELQEFHEPSIPLPLVFLAPQTNTLEEVPCQEDGVGYKISFPFAEMIEDYQNFLKGKKDWNLGRSGKYFRILGKKIGKCRTIEEIDKLMDELIKNKEIPEKTGDRIKAVMRDIWNQKILDISNGIQAKWRLIKKLGETDIIKYQTPIITCLKARLVPIFTTDDISIKDYFPQWFKYIAEDIFNAQTKDIDFILNDTQVWMYIDEITAIASKMKPTVATEAIKTLYTRGRMKRIGLFCSTQNYHKLFDEIIQNSTYCFSFKQKSEEARLIANDFNLEKSERKTLTELPPHKMMAKSTLKDGFTIIDDDGNVEESGGAYCGYSLHPLSLHKLPRQSGV